jgi:hypothetical protein
MSISQRHRIRLTALALGASILAVGAPLAVGASTKVPTTASVLSAAKASMLKEGGVHVVVDSKAGVSTSRVVVDIGTSNGMEIITAGKKFVSVIVTPRYAYLRGSLTGLIKIMGLTAVQQKKLGNRSMSMKAGTVPYTNLKANLTTPVFASMLPAVTGTTLSTAHLDDQGDHNGAASEECAHSLVWKGDTSSHGGCNQCGWRRHVDVLQVGRLRQGERTTVLLHRGIQKHLWLIIAPFE